MNLNIREELQDEYPDVKLLFADGHDHAILGVEYHNGVVVYSVDKIVRHMIDVEGMLPDEAMEYFDFNIAGAYVGKQTPIWVNDA